jgi:hypothetical protein
MWDGPEYHLSLIITILFIGFLLTYLYIFYLPFYNYKTTVIQAQFCAVYLWCGICLVVALLEGNPDDAGPITLFYIGSIWIWKLTADTCKWRRSQLMNMEETDIKNAYEAELKIRYILIENHGSLKVPVVEDVELNEEIEGFYFNMEKRFPDSSFLQLFIA